MSLDPFPFTLNKKFIRESAKMSGFNFLTSIAEICDNSISAGATNIKIEIVKQDQKHATLIISDNGVGMDQSKLIDAISQIGYDGEYNSKSISYYGAGVKFALFYLCEFGKVTYNSTFDGLQTELWFTTDDTAGFINVETPVKSLIPNGTKVTITNVIFDFEKDLEPLRRFLSVTYFPKFQEDKNFFMLCPDITKNYPLTKIKFENPLYSNLTVNENGLAYFNRLDEVAIVNDIEVKISGFIYNKNAFTEEDFIDWDSKCKVITKGRPKDYGFTSDRSGVYFVCGSRFATLGNHNFLFWRSQYDTVNLRICVEVPRALFNKFLQLNKSKIQMSELGLEDFKAKISKIYYEHDRSLQKPAIVIKDDSEKEQMIDELNEGLKGKVEKNPLERPDLQAIIPEEPKSELKDHQGGTKNRPTGIKTKKHYMDVEFVSRGQRTAHYDASRINTKLIIKLNVDHPYVQNFMSKNVKEKQQMLNDIYAEFIALCDTQASEDFSMDCFYKIIENKSNTLRKLYA